MDYKELEKWIESVDRKLDNHLVHVEGRLSNIETDMSWIKRFFWAVTGATVTSLVGAMAALILK